MSTSTTPSSRNPEEPVSASAENLNDRPRLTEQEKKSNHIASEQKRRQAIRDGFDEIADLVPGLKGQGRSEAIVLQGAVAYMRKLLAERHRLVLQGRASRVDVRRWEMDETTMRFAKEAAIQRADANSKENLKP